MSEERYDPNEIELKWREYWASNRLHEAKDDDPRPKYYCLDMFPYPSGSGLARRSLAQLRPAGLLVKVQMASGL